MEFGSINSIRNLRDQIREKINIIDKQAFGEQRFGPENEYSYKGLLGGIDGLLIDISTLTKAPNQFIKISIYNERNLITTCLQNILNYLDQPQNLWPHIETLKTMIRPYQVRYDKNRFIEFNEELDKLVLKKIEFETKLNNLKSLMEEGNQIKGKMDNDLEDIHNKKEVFISKLNELGELKNRLTEQLDSSKNLIVNLDSIKSSAEEKLKIITTSYNESQSNEKLITSFANKVQERENRLDQIENDTQSYQTNLSEFTKERGNLLDEAKSLIESAKVALNYKTAEGISASFQTQYENAKKSNNWLWLIGSGIGLSLTIGIGIWIMIEKNSPISIVLGRIALLPFPIAGAIFCANLFVRQKNIIEDYAYKMVLAKSIVGFSEQIKKHCSSSNEEYVHYMRKVLEEIHKDPLRKRIAKNESKENSEILNFDKALEFANRILKVKND
jgi:DNA repair exonuclease SbcCD ATPase subunit